jgi:hypothetical protein
MMEGDSVKSCSRLAARCLSALLLPASIAAQGTFAGSITYQVDPSGTGIQGGPTAMTFEVNGPHRRIDITMDAGSGTDAGGMGGMAAMMGRSISTIMDESSDTIKTLFNDKKLYIVHAMAPPSKSAVPDLQSPSQPDKSTQPPAVQFTKTGKTETIAGVPCDDYLVAQGDPQKQTLVCNARGFGFLWGSPTGLLSRMQQMGPGMSQYSDMMKQFKDGFFPLKVAQVSNGQEHIQMVATKIDHTAPAAAAFQVPSDFTSLQMGGMGGAGMGAPHGP